MITFDSSSETVSGGIGITEERRDYISNTFFDEIGLWQASEDDITTRDLLMRVFAIAETEAEQCFILYLYGRFIQKEYGEPSFASCIMELLKNERK